MNDQNQSYFVGIQMQSKSLELSGCRKSLFDYAERKIAQTNQSMAATTRSETKNADAIKILFALDMAICR